jgi:N-[(2S)-2-amino-2-carboxyethyl]-L-glutamate dehydrogenase
VSSSSPQPVRVLTGDDVQTLLQEREAEIVQAVREAYLAHARGASALPHSTFLRFPGQPRDRIIALPAYLEPIRTSGIKWISSFPGNTERGIERASALIALNCVDTGRVTAILEGAVISAKRTAASAALAAAHLAAAPPSSIAFVGGGVISAEVLRFAVAVCPSLRQAVVYDVDGERAEKFVERAQKIAPRVSMTVAAAADDALTDGDVVCFATTALAPHVSSLGGCRPGATILHLSLRDLSPECVLACDNVVDDVEHVCRAGTSVHLAAEQVGNRAFIRCTLADVLDGRQPPRAEASQAPTVFSPFGLGVLDLAVARVACDHAARVGRGVVLDSFAPTAAAL